MLKDPEKGSLQIIEENYHRFDGFVVLHGTVIPENSGN